MSARTEAAWDGFVDDASPLGGASGGPPDGHLGEPGTTAAARAYAHRSLPLAGALVVPDTDVPALPDGFDGPVAVVVTGGAGQLAGPAALCTRRGVRLARLEVALRDLDDLPGNARRVVAAVDAVRAEGVLSQEPVSVELPAGPPGPPGPDWLAAADELAAADLRLALRGEGRPADLAARVDAALDRELPFSCPAGLHRAVRHQGPDGTPGHGFLNLLLATRLAFDGAAPAEVVEVLEQPDADALRATYDAIGADAVARTRRWFTSFAAATVEGPHADLVGLGLLDASA
jgi:hypothetical protein